MLTGDYESVRRYSRVQDVCAFKSFENTGPGDADSAWVKVPAARLRPVQTSLLVYTVVFPPSRGAVWRCRVRSSDLSLWDSIPPTPDCICF